MIENEALNLLSKLLNLHVLSLCGELSWLHQLGGRARQGLAWKLEVGRGT